MNLPTGASLCAALGQHLEPVPGFDAPPTPVTAVHISELIDPLGDPYEEARKLIGTSHDDLGFRS